LRTWKNEAKTYEVELNQYKAEITNINIEQAAQQVDLQNQMHSEMEAEVQRRVEEAIAYERHRYE